MSTVLIDLTHPVTTGMPVFPGDPTVSFHEAATVAADGFAVSSLHMGTHSGTHVDAPSHSIDGAAAVDAVDLNRFHGRARIVHVPAPRAQHRIGLDEVAPQLVDLQADEIVLFHTGWSEHFHTHTYFEHPYLDADIAGYLVDHQVRSVGMDLLSPDHTPLDNLDPGPVHLPFHDIFLGAGGVIFENLTNLAAVTTDRPLFSALPLRLTGLDGSPVRAVILNDQTTP
jgi:kynurenine formamidase